MNLFGWYLDPVYLLVVVITLVVSIAAQLYVSSAYRKWSGVRNGSGLTGRQVGYAIVNRAPLGGGGDLSAVLVETPELKQLADLRDKGIVTEQEYQAKRKQIQPVANDTAVNTSSIAFQKTPGQMTDNYNPRKRTVSMSEGVATKPSVAAMAIVAHELGHAQQHEQGSVLIKMRNFLVPAVSFSSPLSFLLILLGWIFYIPGLFSLGVLFFAVMVLFTLVTLPVEFDASRRGIALLGQAKLMKTEADEQGTRRVLRAAAMTYVAAAVTAILKLLYFLRLGGRRRR
ncbi:zinc metallopeptidase [Chloroflexota bacterium]